MSSVFRFTLVALLLGGACAYIWLASDRSDPKPRHSPIVTPLESTIRGAPAAYPSQSQVSPSSVAPHLATCAEPVRLRIGQIDPQFKLDSTTLESALQRAATEWNNATGHTWFQVSETEGIVVNLLFDGRQEDIEQRKLIEEELTTEIALLKERQAEVTAEGLSVQRLITSWNEEKASYESRVATFNSAASNIDPAQPRDQSMVETLERERNDITILRQQLEASAAQMNQTVGLHNAKAGEVERAGELLSKKIEALRERFPPQLIREAEHRSGAFVNEINIYTFTDADTLHFALLHELGHTLGLTHSDVPEAIMAPIRQMGASSTHLTTVDVEAARALCRNRQPG